MAQDVAASGEETFGVLAEFDHPDELVEACEQVRDAGFTAWDAHTPFPIHGLERAMGLRRSWVSAYCLILGLSGAAAGMFLQYWVAVHAYPLVISGKPFFSWPAFVPVMFECGVLGGAFGAVLGFLIQSRLPQHYHALFYSDRFTRVTDDGFFISIEAGDPKFEKSKTLDWLRGLGARHVEAVEA